MNRIDIRLTTESLTSHFPVRQVLKRMDVITDDSFRFCGDEEKSGEHLLCSYVTKENTRRRLLKNCILGPLFYNNIDLTRLLKYIKNLRF